MNNPIKCYIAEFLGTFTLVLVGTAVATLQGGFLAGYGDTGWLGISLAFGGTLAVLVLVIGPVSGCHINPAVTIPMAMSGRLPGKLVPGYLISQITGAIVASSVLLVLMRNIPGYVLEVDGLGANGNPRDMAIVTLLAWEVMLTAMFLFTIFTATRPDAPDFAAPFAIGGFLFVAHLIGAQLGDSSLNPARSLGPALIVRGDALDIVWVFIVAPIVGGMLGWVLYYYLYDNAGGTLVSKSRAASAPEQSEPKQER
ncbi:MAG: aquaporin [Candidatus Hydrogenedentota bacterium]